MAAERAIGLLLVCTACALSTPLGELPVGSESTTSSESETDPAASTTAVDPTTDSEGTTGGVVGPQPMHAWVMRYDQWIMATAEDDGGGGTGPGDSGVGSETGSEIAPDALVVQISTGLDDCEDPDAVLECGGQWQIWMVIPPELQAPGSYELFGQLSAFVVGTGELEPGGMCSGGGGTLEGTAMLTAVSEQEVRGTLVDADVLELFGVEANVEFVALGCG